MKGIRVALVDGLVATLVGLALAAPAKATVFSGQDDGSPIQQPLSSYTNSFAAFNSFLSGLSSYGVEERHGFGLVTNTFQTGTGNGFHNLILNPPYTLTINYTSTFTNYGATYSGFNTVSNGPLYGFGVGTNNTTYLGFGGSGTVTFSFVNPTNAFGLWLTGLQSSTFGDNMTFAPADGTGVLYSPVLNENGGAQFFGFTDPSSFSSVTLSFTSSIGADAWGIDNVSFSVPETVPLPGTLPLLVGGLGGLALLRWRSKKKAAALAA